MLLLMRCGGSCLRCASRDACWRLRLWAMGRVQGREEVLLLPGLLYLVFTCLLRLSRLLAEHPLSLTPCSRSRCPIGVETKDQSEFRDLPLPLAL